MFQLYVSHNCGNTYCFDCETGTVAELRPRLDELDAEGYRWYLEEDGEDYFEEVCAIHQGIFEIMDEEVRCSELVRPKD